jgi:hypothetical protein
MDSAAGNPISSHCPYASIRGREKIPALRPGFFLIKLPAVVIVVTVMMTIPVTIMVMPLLLDDDRFVCLRRLRHDRHQRRNQKRQRNKRENKFLHPNSSSALQVQTREDESGCRSFHTMNAHSSCEFIPRAGSAARHISGTQFVIRAFFFGAGIQSKGELP